MDAFDHTPTVSGRAEPSLRTIVLAYYAKRFAEEDARSYAEEYIDVVSAVMADENLGPRIAPEGKYEVIEDKEKDRHAPCIRRGSELIAGTFSLKPTSWALASMLAEAEGRGRRIQQRIFRAALGIRDWGGTLSLNDK